MKINAKKLAQILKVLNLVALKKATYPLLENILVSLPENSNILTLKAINLAVDLTQRIEVEKEEGESFEFLIDANRFLKVVSNLSGDIELKFDQEKNTLKILAPGRLFRIATYLEVDKYPEPINDDFQEIYRGDMGFLFNIPTLLKFAEKGSTRALENILIRTQNNKVIMTATDGIKLIERRIETETDFAEEKNILLPGSQAQILYKIITSEPGNDIILSISEKFLKIETEGMTSYFRLSDLQYPDYVHILPEPSEKRLIVARNELLHAINELINFVGDDERTIVWDIFSDRLVLRAQDIDFGVAGKVTIQADWSGEHMKIGFIGKHLLPIIEAWQDVDIIFYFTEPSKPVYLEANNMRLLLMPVDIFE